MSAFIFPTTYLYLFVSRTVLDLTKYFFLLILVQKYVEKITRHIPPITIQASPYHDDKYNHKKPWKENDP